MGSQPLCSARRLLLSTRTTRAGRAATSESGPRATVTGRRATVRDRARPEARVVYVIVVGPERVRAGLDGAFDAGPSDAVTAGGSIRAKGNRRHSLPGDSDSEGFSTANAAATTAGVDAAAAGPQRQRLISLQFGVIKNP